jgi:hypothetical protein
VAASGRAQGLSRENPETLETGQSGQQSAGEVATPVPRRRCLGGKGPTEPGGGKPPDGGSGNRAAFEDLPLGQMASLKMFLRCLLPTVG